MQHVFVLQLCFWPLLIKLRVLCWNKDYYYKKTKVCMKVPHQIARMSTTHTRFYDKIFTNAVMQCMLIPKKRLVYSFLSSNRDILLTLCETKFNMFDLPTQLNPFPLQPVLHAHVYDP